MAITVDNIIESLEEMARTNQVVDSGRLLDAANKLNILIGEEHDKLAELQQEVAKTKAKLIEDGYSVAKADAVVQAEDVHKMVSKQKARIGRIEEFIRIAKLQAKLKTEEYRNYA